MIAQTDVATRQQFDEVVRSGQLSSDAVDQLRTRLSRLAFYMEIDKRLDRIPDEVSVAGLCNQRQAIAWLFNGPARNYVTPFQITHEEQRDGEQSLREAERLGFVRQAANGAVRFSSLELQRYFCAVYIFEGQFYPICNQAVTLKMPWLYAYWLEYDPHLIDNLIEAATTPSTEAHRQEYALWALGRIGDSRAFEPLLGLMQDTTLDSSLRLAAAKALARLGDSRAVAPQIEALGAPFLRHDHLVLTAFGEPAFAALLDALRHDQPLVRMAAARELGAFGDPRAVPPLIAALSDSDRSVREAIIESLGGLGDGRAIEPILALMYQPQDILNYQVLSALQDLEAKQAIPLLIEALKMDTGWGEEIAHTLDFVDVDGWALQTMFATPESRQVIEDAHYIFEDDRVIAYWQRQLETLAEPDDAEQIKRILWTLRSHPDKRVIPVLLKWLDNYPKDVVKTLGGTGDPTVSGVIIARLNDPDVAVRREAAQALANFQDERVMLALIDLLPHEPDAAVRRDVAWALTNFQDKRAVLALIDVLQHDPDTWTRVSTARQLSRWGTAPAITALHEALADPEAEVRIAAIKALDILRDSTAIPLLESLRQTDTERLSNGDAVWVLAELAIRNLQNEISAARPLTTP